MENVLSDGQMAMMGTLFICALVIPFLLPRLGAAVGMMMTGYGAWLGAMARNDLMLPDFHRTVGGFAIGYGLLWVALGVACHILRRRALEPA